MVLLDQYFFILGLFLVPCYHCFIHYPMLCGKSLDIVWITPFIDKAIDTWEHPDIKVQYSEERCCSNIQIFIAPQCCKMYPWPCGKRNLCGRYQSKEFIFHVHYTSVEKALEIFKKIPSQTWRRGWRWWWYIYYDEVSVCHEKSSLSPVSLL